MPETTSPLIGNHELPAALSFDVVASRDDLVALRRDFHRHPELGHREERTQRRVRAHLEASGVPHRPIAGTGVLAEIVGPTPGPTVLLRADLDALPIQEEGEHDYRSTIDGQMHACGHDAHAAMLLVVARLLAQRGLPRGRVRLLFQPAEEGLGGAAAVLTDGLLDEPRPEVALAMHVWSPYPVGTVVALDGPATANVDGFLLHIHGRGAHAATPEAGVDPMLIAAQIMTAAQSLVTRRTSAHDPAVLTFGGLTGADTWNVIPDHVTLAGTIRCYDPEVRTLLRDELAQLAASIAQGMHGESRYETTTAHIAVHNTPAVAHRVREEARAFLGPDAVPTPRPLTVGEDFAEIVDEIPGALVLLGCGNPERGIVHPHHHPRFDIDERVLPIGVELALRFAEDHLR